MSATRIGCDSFARHLQHSCARLPDGLAEELIHEFSQKVTGAIELNFKEKE
jgi:hypothetical protein